MERKIMDAGEVAATLDELARQVSRGGGLKRMVIVGIKRRGAVLAGRIRGLLQESSGREIPLGFLDITLYRDDFSTIGAHPVVSETELLFDIEDKTVVLVDDVLYTGRTVRAALDALIDLGRPSFVKLAVLVDRGHREFPIRADFIGRKVRTRRNEMVEVRLAEVDGTDEVIVTVPTR